MVKTIIEYKTITLKADELARQYNKTKDPKIKEEWFKLVRTIPPPLEHMAHTQIEDTF